MSHPVHLILSAGTRIVTRNEASHLPERPDEGTMAGLNALLVRVRCESD